MTDPTHDSIRDAVELRDRLDRLTVDLRTLDLAGFRHWLDLRLARWQADPVFVQRARIRDLRRAHPEARQLDAEYRRAARAVAAGPALSRMATLEKALHRAERAVSGLSGALESAASEQRPHLQAKRDHFLTERCRLEASRDELVRSSPEHQRLGQAATAVRRAWKAIGLDREEEVLAKLLTARGRGTGRAGTKFEQDAFRLTDRIIRADLDAKNELRVLRAVRLGAAGVELDLAFVRQAGEDDPVEVLAVVEAKRNINDLAHGFRRRQVDLAWLTGDTSGYDPAAHRTRHFPTGHFDRPAVHWQEAGAFLFAPDSFRRFARDASGYFRDGLYLLTRVGPIWGVSAAALARIAARVSTDDDWDPDDDEYLTRLFAWGQSMAQEIETPDVLRLYEADCRARVLVSVE